MRRLRFAFRLLRLILRGRCPSFRVGRCPFCGPTAFMKYGESEFAIRCSRCGSNSVTLSIGSVLVHEVPDLARRHVYEVSSRSALARCLRKHAGRVTLSQYFEDVPLGELKDGVQCQDVQRLTYPDACFDICTSSEVFEHVADDSKGFREMCRVLKPGGLLLFTVPLSGAEKTTERARLTENGIEHILEPSYHDDPILGPRTALAFRDYGMDIVDRLERAGFVRCRVVQSEDVAGWGFARRVVSARVTSCV